MRLAAVVAAGNLPDAAAVPLVLDAPNPEKDKFLELAARTALAVLKPQVDSTVGEWRARTGNLRGGSD